MMLVYFASVKQKLGLGEETLAVPEGVVTARDLAAHLRSRGGAYDSVFADLATLRVAIDQEHAPWDAPIGGAREIAVFPPVTGGMQSQTQRLIGLTGQAFAALLAGTAGGLVREGPVSALGLSGEPLADLNMMVIGTSNEAAATLETYAAIAAERALPLLALFEPGIAGPLAAVLSRHGFVEAGEVPLMQLPADRAVTAQRDCLVRLARPIRSDIDLAADLQARGFGLPLAPMRRMMEAGFTVMQPPEVFIAERGGVAMSSVSVTAHGTTAGIWSMATPPEFQRQGLGRGLLSQVLDIKRKQGVKDFFLYATTAGQPLYEHLGFVTRAAMEAFVHGQSVQAHG